MRAIEINETGGPDVLRLVDRPAPEPRPTDLLVRLMAAGVNPVDTKLRRRGVLVPDGLPEVDLSFLGLITYIGVRDLERGFREIAPLAGHCQFGDCRHDQEPGCAVRAAVEDGRVHPDRFANFRHMAARLEATERR
jgi:hypothetical protein